MINVDSDMIRSDVNAAILKGIVNDSNNIFLCHKSEDMNKRSFPKFQLIQILCLQVMHD